MLLADVLEHLAEPLKLLEDAKQRLEPDGVLLVSLPNVAHRSMRAQLAVGRFDYTNKGLLDRGHLRFFTHASALRLFHDAGLEVVSRADHAGALGECAAASARFDHSRQGGASRLFPGAPAPEFVRVSESVRAARGGCYGAVSPGSSLLGCAWRSARPKIQKPSTPATSVSRSCVA